MLPAPAAPRPPSLYRRLGKFALFLARGHAPGLAWWLAVHDAPKQQDFRAVSRDALTSAFRADPSWADLESSAGHLRSRALGLEFQRDDLINRGYQVWRALAALGWSFERLPEGGLLAKHGTLRLRLNTDEECDMIREIYFSPRCYDLRVSGDWHVVDIGANVGMAALFFAQQPWCRKVTSFEPFAPTAAAFREHMALNPDLAAKITLVPKGVGEADTTLTVDYHPELRGSMSVAGLGAWRGDAAPGAQKVSVAVERASSVLAPVFAARGGCRLMAKIDCEGSEYGIFRELETSGALAQFSAFVIEWHGRGPDELLAVLLRRGFATYVSPLSEDHHTLGLIYAMRLDAPSGRS